MTIHTAPWIYFSDLHKVLDYPELPSQLYEKVDGDGGFAMLWLDDDYLSTCQYSYNVIRKASGEDSPNAIRAKHVVETIEYLRKQGFKEYILINFDW